MLIDWLTVAAQIVNFLALVALLKHFLFGRLVAAIDAREKRIAARLAEADQKNREAEQMIENVREQSEKQRHERDEILTEARNEAEHQRHDLVEKAREAVRALETKWRDDLEREKAAFFDEIRARSASEILAIARRALKDLAGVELQEKAIEAFFNKLEPDAVFDQDVVVRSAQELSPESRRQIEQTLQSHLRNGARLSFETAPQMAWGIELRSNGRRIGWNPDTYIASLEDNLRESLEHRWQ